MIGLLLCFSSCNIISSDIGKSNYDFQDLLEVKKVVMDNTYKNNLIYYKTCYKECFDIDSFFIGNHFFKDKPCSVVNWKLIDSLNYYEDEYTIKLKDSILSLRKELNKMSEGSTEKLVFDPLMYFYTSIQTITKYRNYYKLVVSSNTSSGTQNVFFVMKDKNGCKIIQSSDIR